MVVTLTPSGRAAPLSTGSCPAASPKGVTATTLDESVLETPLDTGSSGTSDIYVGILRFAPGGRVGWHVQQRPFLLGVGEGNVTLELVEGGTCRSHTYSAEKGFFEPPGTVHEVRNDGSTAARFYLLGFVPNPQPMIAPAAPPKECGTQ